MDPDGPLRIKEVASVSELTLERQIPLVRWRRGRGWGSQDISTPGSVTWSCQDQDSWVYLSDWQILVFDTKTDWGSQAASSLSLDVVRSWFVMEAVFTVCGVAWALLMPVSSLRYFSQNVWLFLHRLLTKSCYLCTSQGHWRRRVVRCHTYLQILAMQKGSLWYLNGRLE